mgnify:CR=1 FL=1
MSTVVHTDIAIEGMTCSACARSIEEGLARVDGVADAHVNFATGRATVDHDDAVAVDALRFVVESLGYRAPIDGDHDAAEAARQDDLWMRFRLAVLLTVPLMTVSMIKPLRFSGLILSLIHI